MFVLGIDPGLTRTGYGLVEKTSRGPLLRAVGVIRTEPGDPIEQRLLEVHSDLTEIIDEHHPDAMAIEQVFTNKNLRTSIAVGRASGVAILAAASAGLPVHEYTPTQVKSAVAGFGKADKGQVQRMVAQRLGLAESPKPADAADALAVALCHLQAFQLMARISR
jgi:crossover junction endodeoxyribonuclease RuvC